MIERKECEIRAEIAKGGKEVEKARWWQQCLEAMRRPSHFWEVRVHVKQCLPRWSFASILQHLYQFAIATKMLCSKLKKLTKCFLTLYTQTSVFIFSILFSVCLLRCGQGKCSCRSFPLFS